MMVHPNNPSARELLAIVWARLLACAKDTFKEAGVKDDGRISSTGIYNAAHLPPRCRDPGVTPGAPSEDKVFAQVKAFYQGYVAGRILQLMGRMQIAGEVPSVEKGGLSAGQYPGGVADADRAKTSPQSPKMLQGLASF